MKASVRLTGWRSIRGDQAVDGEVERIGHDRGAAGGGDQAVGLDPGAGVGRAGEEIDAHRDLGVDLDAGAADLAVAHRGVDVAERQQRAGDVDRQVDARAGRGRVEVDVAALGPG